MIHHQDDWLTIHVGDARAVLAELEAESINCVVTSPPYYGLRDYGAEGQIGLEPTPEAYIAALVDVFRGIRRALRKDGTVWLNLGDSYAGSRGSTDDGDRLVNGKTLSRRRDNAPIPRSDGRAVGFKPKDRMMMPARVAISLQADGWWLRDEIVWAKPNPMPSSVADRTTPAHEMVYLLTKSARYAYDADAIREPTGTNTHSRGGRDVPAGWNAASFELGEGHGSRTAANNPKIKVPGGWMVGPGTHSTTHSEGRTAATYVVDDGRWPRGWAHGEGRGHDPQVGRYAAPIAHTAEIPFGRNKRSVWTISTQAYPEAHFATFPEALVEPMILAGCPAGGVVLDPFGGSGTVALVAQRLGRKAVLIDLSPEYAAQMVKRIAGGRASGEGPAVDMPVPFADDGLWGVG